jgi:hypothetical protein
MAICQIHVAIFFFFGAACTGVPATPDSHIPQAGSTICIIYTSVRPPSPFTIRRSYPPSQNTKGAPNEIHDPQAPNPIPHSPCQGARGTEEN